MKSVILSIKPRYCELIANDLKTIEVRKTRPKLETPFKVYIYCTNAAPYLVYGDKYDGGSFVPQYCTTRGYSREEADKIWGVMNGKVIGEFVCDFINKYTAEFVNDNCYEDIRQVWENDDFTIVTSNEDENPNNCFLCNASCLSFDDIKKYIGVNFHEIPFYALHISNLVIYDKPKELSEYNLTRPPQSWCYIKNNEVKQ